MEDSDPRLSISYSYFILFQNITEKKVSQKNSVSHTDPPEKFNVIAC